MRKLDMIIGCSAVKKELLQIADTLKNQGHFNFAGVRDIKNSCNIVPVTL